MRLRASVLAVALLALAACDGTDVTSTAAPPTPSPGCAPTDANALRAVSLSFDRDCMAVPAAAASTIALANDDAGESHNVAVYPADSCLALAVAAGKEPRCASPTDPAVFRGAVILGVAQITYDVPALPGGAYVFVCEVHLFMHGTFRVR